MDGCLFLYANDFCYIIRVDAHGPLARRELQNDIIGKEAVDGGGNYLLPGFIDVHMHVESTMMVPENFGKAAVIAKGNEDFVAAVNEVINKVVNDGSYQAAYDAAVADSGEAAE